jgi:hypothetical protein
VSKELNSMGEEAEGQAALVDVGAYRALEHLQLCPKNEPAIYRSISKVYHGIKQTIKRNNVCSQAAL